MLTGSCLCGKVEYQLDMDSQIDSLVYCHCSRCRKWNGSAFNVAIAISVSQFKILTGQTSIKAFSANGVNRHFCANCGSNLFTSRDNNKAVYRLRMGTLNEPIYPKQKIHIYTGSKANWDLVCDGGIEFTEGVK